MGSNNWEIPEYRIDRLNEKRQKYAICVFVINEGEKFRQQLEKMQPYHSILDIVIADGGSRDGSTDPSFLKSNYVSTLLTKTGPGKLSAQMRMAFGYCLNQGYEGIITIDGNNKDDPQGIPAFIACLDQGYDHIQGSRFIPGGRAVNTPISRWLAVKLIHAPLISLASGFHYTDTTNGFRGYSSRFLLDPRVAPFRNCFSTYELHYYLAIRAARLGFKVIETPVTRSYPKTGKMPTKISPFKGNLQIIKILLKAVLNQYDPR